MKWMTILTACALSVLVIGTASAADWASAETITIVATEYGFRPARLTLRARASYRLHFENQGKELHEFTAPAFLGLVEIRNPEVLNADRTELALQPGDRKDLWIVPRQAGRYPFACADHDWAGMTGEIVVE